MRIKRKFFNRNTVIIAKELLGKYLVRKIPSAGSGQAAKIIRVRITETEAYCGIRDLACHASKGMTPRTKIMFGQPGYAYIYMIYGMYHCLNFVTEKEGNPSAVLIRTAEFPISNSQFPNKFQNSNSKIKKLKGPGILCRELKIDRKLNGIDVTKSGELWVEEGEKIKPSQIKKGKRIGIGYAGVWQHKLWRFYLK